MSVIEKARELGKALQEDERYVKYLEAKKQNDTDTELQNMIGEFNMKRMQLNQEMQKEDKDEAAMQSLNNELTELYNKVMANQNMVAFSEAQQEMDKVLQSVQYIITCSANGEDPMTCPEEEPHNCSGSCSSCGGCH